MARLTKPVKSALRWVRAKLKRLFIRLFWRPILRLQYEYVSSFDKRGEITFMNYGYADPEDEPFELPEDDEPNRYSIQLYRRLIGGLDLSGTDLLEVGCGRGGGIAYIRRDHSPRSITGVDFCKRAIQFCSLRYPGKDLDFVQGNAEWLKFDAASFDVIVNVESSHCYGKMDRFLNKAAEILRPNGYLLLADFRTKADLAPLREMIAAAGLQVLQDDDITAQVVEALDRSGESKLELIRERAKPALEQSFKTFAAVPGTPIYEKLENRDLVYFVFTLQKPPQAPQEP